MSTIEKRLKLRRIALISAIGTTLGIMLGFAGLQPFGVFLTAICVVSWLLFAVLSVDSIW